MLVEAAPVVNDQPVEVTSMVGDPSMEVHPEVEVASVVEDPPMKVPPEGEVPIVEVSPMPERRMEEEVSTKGRASSIPQPTPAIAVPVRVEVPTLTKGQPGEE